MIAIDIQSVAGTKIAVTDTATALYTLMNTAGTTKNAQQYYSDRFASALMITPEDGNIRYLIRGTPTSTEGQILYQGNTYYLPGVELSEMKLIRIGGANVATTVIPYKSEPGESPCAVAHN
jgi:hypothetical protein